jgi:hypothetical protein
MPTGAIGIGSFTSQGYKTDRPVCQEETDRLVLFSRLTGGDDLVERSTKVPEPIPPGVTRQ